MDTQNITIFSAYFKDTYQSIAISIQICDVEA